MKHVVIVVAGGRGNRMQSDVPKQFLSLGGKPVLMHTLQRFADADPAAAIILVLPGNKIESWKMLCAQHQFKIDHRIVAGGETRHASVKNGLAAVSESCIVAIHDGVRPFASAAFIRNCFTEAERHGTAVPCIPVLDSLRIKDGPVSKAADRNLYVLIQTPQCFDSALLKNAYAQSAHDAFTDDASLVESKGAAIHLVDGETHNIKITFPEDLFIGEMLLEKYFSGK